MFLGELLGTPVRQDGAGVGFVTDLRLFVPDHTGGVRAGTPQVYGLLVCPRQVRSFLGYQRNRVREPRALARIFRWRGRGSFVVLWPDVLAVADGSVELRPGAVHYSSDLR